MNALPEPMALALMKYFTRWPDQKAEEMKVPGTVATWDARSKRSPIGWDKGET
jgi:hypothetical protein